jgi:hypothetical protein
VGTTLSTCERHGDCLAWSDAKACADNGICCGAECIAADENNCFACGQTCKSPTPACNTQAKKCGCIAATCAGARQGCDPQTGECADCSPFPDGAADLYVDSGSFDGATGIQACPFRTIRAALDKVAQMSAKNVTIHLAAGSYSAETGEIFPIVLRGGTSLVGAGSGKTIIQGTGTYNHTAEGGQLNDATLSYTLVLGDETAMTTLRGFTVLPQSSISNPPPLTVLGILCDRGTGPATLGGTLTVPNTALDDVVVGPNFANGMIVTNSTAPASGCNIKVRASSFTTNARGVWVLGAGRNGMTGPTVAAHFGDGTDAGGVTFANSFALNNGYGIGLLRWDGVHTFVVEKSTFRANLYGLSIAGHDATTPVVRINGNHFTENRTVALYLTGYERIDELNDNTIEETTAATAANVDELGTGIMFRNDISAGMVSVLAARGNKVINNEVGIRVRAGANPPLNTLDFGTAASAGGNDIACNASTHAGVDGGDLLIDMNKSFPNFQGNRWDHASLTTTGAGADLALSNGALATTTGNTVTAVTCSAGHVR